MQFSIVFLLNRNYLCY